MGLVTALTVLAMTALLIWQRHARRKMLKVMFSQPSNHPVRSCSLSVLASCWHKPAYHECISHPHIIHCSPCCRMRAAKGDCG